MWQVVQDWPRAEADTLENFTHDIQLAAKEDFEPGAVGWSKRLETGIVIKSTPRIDRKVGNLQIIREKHLYHSGITILNFTTQKGKSPSFS